MPIYDENNKKFNVIGQNLKRVDALEKVKATAIYAADASKKHMLVGGSVRIKEYLAKILKVDVEEALKVDEIVKL